MQVNTKGYIIDEYKSLLGEQLSTIVSAAKANSYRNEVFKDDKRIKDLFINELNLYLNGIKYQKKILWFLFKNEKQLNYNCIDRTIELLENYGNSSYLYMDSLIGMLNTACDMEADYKFYLPRKKFEYVNENNYEMFIRLASGFEYQVVKDFLAGHDILNYNQIDNIYKEAKVINADDNSFYGVFEKGIVVPKINDDRTALINIHELVHKSLIINKEKINNNDIVYGEELPIFYEMLYKAYNGLVKCDTNYNEISEKLLYNYNSEPFFEQVKKLEKIK